MFLPNDLSARLKSLRRARVDVTAYDGVSTFWAGLIFFTIVCVSSLILLSIQRFAYWSDIDRHLASVEGEPPYDEKKLAAILAEFASKRDKSEGILMSMSAPSKYSPVVDEAATSSDPVAGAE